MLYDAMAGSDPYMGCTDAGSQVTGIPPSWMTCQGPDSSSRQLLVPIWGPLIPQPQAIWAPQCQRNGFPPSLTQHQLKVG